eukprot:CAMPEP_0198543332 /NCGR_PEP_ID=MMETSP1462-20131121/59611_1 /TAXON_ID=1333877 /ORGANISM="Brandtodinium nutriculum, Strain RCC3387" /LENGTH=107 /DNA_ID=CAMNT_0044273609 /DNA_START=65 /DNA_END=385 /DNA_ORIENTATION=-
MAPVLKLIAVLACVAQMSSASLPNGTTAAKALVALRGTADTSERPGNMTMPMVAEVTCPLTYGDKDKMYRCLAVTGCAWSEGSGCRDWADDKFCQQQSISKDHTSGW